MHGKTVKKKLYFFQGKINYYYYDRASRDLRTLLSQ